MPRSFSPRERKRKRETGPPVDPKKVEALVDKIAREYREEMRKRGEVDIWGQPKQMLDKRKLKHKVEKNLQRDQEQERERGEKKLRKKSDRLGLIGAVAQTLAEAAGKKFREKEQSRSVERKSDINSSREKSERDSSPRQRERKRTQVKPRKEGSLKSVLDDAKKKKQEEVDPPKAQRRKKERIRGKEIERYHKVNHYVPKVRGEEVRSYKHLEDIMKREFPGFMKIKNLDKLMDDARTHFDLIDRLQGRNYLEYGEVAKIAREIDRGFDNVHKWSVSARRPKVYMLLDTAISRSEGLARIEKAVRENNGIRSMHDIERRLGQYYAEKEYRSSPNYKKALEMAGRYFKFLDLLKQGGSLTEMSRQVGTSQDTISMWYDGKTSWMVKLASSIPQKKPSEGYVWLPTITGSQNNPRGFIEVPHKITNHQSVEHVLKQLESKDVKQLEKRFGPATKSESFMYVLGSLLSDGSTQFAYDSSLAGSRMGQGLGRSYDWSEQYGEGTRYHLSKIGIEMHRIGDREYNPDSSSYPSSGAYSWQSQFSPLITWMRRSCLGLKDTESKTHDAVRADWILSAPTSWRTSFLQGVCDGDGCASKAAQFLSIATSANSEFYQDLLKSLGMKSHEGDGAVVVGAHDSVRRAEEIGMFRYATSRKENLAKLAKMIDTYYTSPEMSPSEIAYVKKMRSQGKSWGSISEALFDKFGHTWPYYTVMRRSRRLGIDKEEKPT